MPRISTVVLGLILSASSATAESTEIGPLQARTHQTIEGVAAHVFGNRFVLQDATGSVLVDAGPRWFGQRTFAVGERLTVEGRLDEDEFEAHRVIRSDGRVEIIRDPGGPPPWAGRRAWNHKSVQD